MNISVIEEEILEKLWTLTVEDKRSNIRIMESGLEHRKELEILAGKNMITLSGEDIILTSSGKEKGEKIVRRHRLAERLLVDVLKMKGKQVDELACEFEHVLHEGIDNIVCTILGHPGFCPHGKPIPPGLCCKGTKTEDLKIITTLADMEPGRTGEVAYLHTRDTGGIQKLLAMGILPGVKISLIRSFPSYILQVENSQFAIDRNIAESIHIRMLNRTEKRQLLNSGHI